MGYVSLSQFKELLRSVVETPYEPRRRRDLQGGPSSELFTSESNQINQIRLKFYLEDDGGSWTDGTLVKPEFIWDMKKIVANSVVDDGGANKKAYLLASNIQEKSEGLAFFGLYNSYLQSNTIDCSSLTTSNFILNLWFEPREFDVSTYGDIFKLFDYQYGLMLNVRIVKDAMNSSKFRLNFLYRTSTSAPALQLSEHLTEFYINRKYNLIISYQSGTLSVFINGEPLMSATRDALRSFGSQGAFFEVGRLYKGEVHYISLNFSSATATQVQNLWKFKYPLPRKKELVDLSKNFENYGENLLIDAGEISKVLENIKGQFYVKTNNITLRS